MFYESQFWLSLQSGHFGSIAYIFVVKLFPLNTIYFLQLTFYIWLSPQQ